MKLKSLIATALMTASLSSFAVDLTLSPVYTVVDVVRSALGSVVGLAASPTALTLASSQQREQLEAIREDAKDFLETEEMSASLSQAIESLKAEKELADKSDTEIAIAIVAALK